MIAAQGSRAALADGCRAWTLGVHQVQLQNHRTAMVASDLVMEPGIVRDGVP
jgi:hypothetical protein